MTAAPSSLQVIGNATTLIRRDGFTVLTDPHFLRRGQRAYFGLGLTAARLKDPAIAVEQVPALDAIALSHLHGDHYDRVARRGLDPAVPVVTTAQGAKRLTRRKVNALGLENWETWSTQKEGGTLRITSLPGRHAPGPVQSLIPKVMGTLLEFERPGQQPYRIYQSGDTLVHDDLRTIAERVPDIDLVLVHLGGTRILGITLTMDGRQGVDFLELLNFSRRTRILPIHYEEYHLMRSPLSDFRSELERRGLELDVRWVNRGESLPLD